MSKPSVSQSKLKKWRTCHNQYYYAFILNLMRRKKGSPLIRGGVIHDMLEAKINKQDPWKVYKAEMKKYSKLFAEEQEDYGDLPAEIKAMAKGYFNFYKPEPLKYIKKAGKSAEWGFEVPLTSKINFKGRIDSAAHSISKLCWLVEHKTHRSLPEGDFKFIDLQSLMYAWVMPICGFPKPDGVCWDYLRAKAPSVPLLLKDGGLSHKNIDTTWEVYSDAIRGHGLKLKDYGDMQEKLLGKENSFFVRSWLPIDDTALENLVEETRTTAKEIIRRAGKDRTRSIGRHCEWCSFSDLCRAEMLNLDSDYILKKNFTESDYGKDKKTDFTV